MRAIIATRSYPVAARFFRRNLQQHSQESTTHFLLAKSLIGQGDHTAARVEIDRALALSPNRPEFVALREQLTGGSVEDRSVINFLPKQRAFESQRTTVCGPRTIEPLRERKQFPRIELWPSKTARCRSLHSQQMPIGELFWKFFSPEDPPGICCRGVIVSFGQVPTLRCEPRCTFAQPDRLVVETSIDSQSEQTHTRLEDNESAPGGQDAVEFFEGSAG